MLVCASVCLCVLVCACVCVRLCATRRGTEETRVQYVRTRNDSSKISAARVLRAVGSQTHAMLGQITKPIKTNYYYYYNIVINLAAAAAAAAAVD